MFGCVAKLQFVQNAARFNGFKCFIQGRPGMRIQVVLYHTDQDGVRKMHIDKVFHTLRIVFCRAPFGHFDMAPARKRLKEQEQITTPFALVFIIVSSGWTAPISPGHF